MKRILMRMGKSPFKVVSAEETLNKNTLGTNIGNSLFQVASHKLLTTAHTEVTAYKFTPSMADVDWVNENFDLFVIPLANAFRVSFKKHLDKHTEFIRKLKIPVMVIGVGIQADLDCTDFSTLIPIEESIKDFCDAVLDVSPSIGVRGKCTLRYLLSLGYTSEQIEIIGCPSMFWHGDKIYTQKKSTYLYSDSKISFNLSPYAKGTDILTKKVLDTFTNVTYIPQNNTDLEQLLYAKGKDNPKEIDKLLTKYFYEKNKVTFFVEPIKWLNFLETCHFSLGTRIHGTIANLIAGTPAHIFVHDSRTKELAEYFEIPYSSIKNIETLNIKEIYQNSDFTGLVKNHKKRFNKIESFLFKHQLGHIFEEENHAIREEYENKYYTTKFALDTIGLKFEEQHILDIRVQYLYKELLNLKTQIKKLTLKK